MAAEEEVFGLWCRGPQDFGLSRPIWTRQLLAKQLYRIGGVRLSPTTVGRPLARIGARWNRPCPVVSCPWPKDKRKELLAQIETMLAELPGGEIGLFEDEVDIHLNPKIGFDWMMRGEQKHLLTPGQNPKRHIAGTLEPLSGQLLWVTAERKDSALFISLLEKAAQACRELKRVHLILDNYCIHKSKATREAAANLFTALRRLDSLGLGLVVAEPVPEIGLGRAIMDRLKKASESGAIGQYRGREDHR